MERHRRILGIDPALTTTGYAVVSADARGNVALVEGGLIRTKSSEALEIRLRTINETLGEIIEEFEPDEVAIEDLHARYRNLKTAIVMGHARGVAILAAGHANIPVHHYQPTRVKSIVAGSGRADKAQMKRAVSMRLGLAEEIAKEDVADAVGIAICHVHVTGSQEVNELVGIG
ncbi:MAG: crossover junction endodeoxyribonuclease RuvC [Chloroflexi bacterium]|nr:crossover junction endodeoxyribonuclease RuvC [Chloroflexota bacterium]